MGRRSINTTKSGKYMNPTDQARKEARKKELKKNKRQRQMVRAAVLKGKDPGQILEEMEKIDEMEYNVLQPSPLNEKVLREKRKKLKETFDRVMRLYHNDDPELWAELKRKEVDYEKKRLKKQQYYESVKSAQSVQIDEIPLPQMNIPPPGGAPMIGSLNRVPPPSGLHIPPFIPDLLQGNSNKYGDSMTTKQSEKSLEKKKKDPPGCPPGPPPDLTKFRELDSDAEDDISIQELIKKTKSKKNLDDERIIPKDDDDSSKSTSIQQKLVQTTGQNIDAFMKEIENVQRNSKKQDSKENSDKDSQKSSDDENDNNNNDGDEDDDDIDDDDDDDSVNSENSEDDDEQQQKPPARKNIDKEQSNLSIPLPPIPPPPPAMGMPGGPPPPPIGMPPAMMFRPPPMRPGGGSGGAIPGITMRMPPGPPPGRPGMQMQHRMGIRMPPGPPPGMPPNRGGMHHHNQKGHHHNHPAKDSKGITTITAKPQIRNLSADVTRFLPSALRVKRDDQKVPATKRPKQYHQEVRQVETKKGATKDDAYMQFMREMQGLL